MITELVNIFDKEKFQDEVEKTTGNAAKADKIASRTAKHISERMEEDPAFYKKFSSMLRDTIKDYVDRRISEAQYLSKVQELMEAILSHSDSEIPEALNGRDVAKAFYGLSLDFFDEKIQDEKVRKYVSVNAAIEIDDLVKRAIMDHGTPIVDWPQKSNITGKLQIDIGDYLIDEVRDKYRVPLSFGEMDEIAGKCIDVAKIRYKG